MSSTPDHPETDRRGFMELTGQAALAAAFASMAGPLQVSWAQEAGASRVAVVGFGNGADAATVGGKLAEAIAAVTDLSWLKAGQKVAIKVASNSGKPYPFTTHAGALQALIRMLRAKGAQVVVADQAGLEWVAPPIGSEQMIAKVRELWRGFHSGTSTGMQVLEMNGLKAAAEAAGAQVRSFDAESDWRPSPPTANWPQGFRIPKLYDEVDHVINFARPAAHVMLGHTTCIKNWYGWLHGMDRLRSHVECEGRPIKDWAKLKFKQLKDLPERIAEVANAFKGKTRLNLVASIDTYCDIGPDWGTQPLSSSSIMASTDMVAIDAASAAQIAWEKRRVPEGERKKNWQGGALDIHGETFYGLVQGWSHDLHGARHLDRLIDDPKDGGIWKVEQVRHGQSIGLGQSKVELATAGQVDEGFLAGLKQLTGAASKPATPSAGLVDELKNASGE